MVFDLKVNIDWKTVLVIGILYYVYKIGIAIFNFFKLISPPIWDYIKNQFISLIKDPFGLFVVGLGIFLMWFTEKTK